MRWHAIQALDRRHVLLTESEVDADVSRMPSGLTDVAHTALPARRAPARATSGLRASVTTPLFSCTRRGPRYCRRGWSATRSADGVTPVCHDPLEVDASSVRDAEKDPFRLPHRLEQASLCAGVGSTPARDDTRSSRSATDSCPLAGRSEREPIVRRCARSSSGASVRTSSVETTASTRKRHACTAPSPSARRGWRA
jgi:hypothetical protein